MTNSNSNLAIRLRWQAEEKAAMLIDTPKVLSFEEIRQTLHELRVHQIELEMQNEMLLSSQAEIEAVQARYFALFNQAPMGYFTLSKEGLILEANLTAAKLLGVAQNALIKQPIFRFILKDDQDVCYLNNKKLRESCESQVCELRMVKIDGSSFWVRLEATAVQYGDGESVRHIVICDISDNKRMEAEKAKLEVQNRQLQKAESLGRMAGAIAHHFNNKLQVVMGNLEMAMKDLPLGINPIESLDSAMQAAFKAAEVSTEMLTYLGQTPSKHELIDLSQACRQCLALLQARAPKGTFLKADFPSMGPVIRGNSGQIHHALSNLVTNAWESAHENRRGIGLTIKTVSQSEILGLKCFPIDWQPLDAAYACLEIADAGCGISEKDIEKIYDPFFSTKFIGRGLGLSVVLGIVRAHHGAITMESEPERGSIFRIFFPLSVEEVAQQPDKAAQAQETKGGGTVLLVDDEELMRNMLKTMLTHLGFTVLEARDGIDAVEVYMQHQDEISCVLTDLTMPRMDGWETLSALRKLSPDIPVILSSGYDESHVMAGEQPERPNAFLGKPYQLKTLSDAINRVIGT